MQSVDNLLEISKLFFLGEKRRKINLLSVEFDQSVIKVNYSVQYLNGHENIFTAKLNVWNNLN